MADETFGGLCAVAAIAVSVGAKSLNRIPTAWINRLTGLILLALALRAAFAAAAG